MSGEAKREAVEGDICGAPLSRVPAAVLRSLPTLDFYTDIPRLPVVE